MPTNHLLRFNRTLSRILAALVLIVGGLSLVPVVSAVCTGGLLGNICVGETSVPTSAGGTFHGQWSFPGAVDTASQVFTVTVEIDTSASAQTLNLPAASAWTYNGCSFTSEATNTVTGVVRSTIARITMTSQFCVISTTVSSQSATSVLTSAIPILMQVEAQSIPVPISGSMSNTISGSMSNTISGSMSNTVTISGGVNEQRYTDPNGVVFVGPPRTVTVPYTAATYTARLPVAVFAPTSITATTISMTGSSAPSCASGGYGSSVDGGTNAAAGGKWYYGTTQPTLSLTEYTCVLNTRVQLVNVATNVAEHVFQTMLVREPSVKHEAIDSWPSLTGSLDTQSRLCAASSLGASCTAPTVNNAVTGTMTVTNAGGQTVTVSGNLDTLQRFCAASAVGTTCSTPTVNNAITGSLSTSITSWPSLTAAVTNSGTINVVNSGGQTFTVSGSLSVANSGSIANTVSGGLTVTDDANGWSTTVASWPQLQAILSGEVHPCSTAALTADPNACRLDTTASNVNVGNNTNNVSIPSTFHLCGEELTPGDCEPIQQAGTLGFTNSTTDHFIPIFVWLGALIFFLRLGKLVAAAASSAGFMGSILTNDNSLQIVALTILGIALWLEATAKEKIYARWAEERDT